MSTGLYFNHNQSCECLANLPSKCFGHSPATRNSGGTQVSLVLINKVQQNETWAFNVNQDTLIHIDLHILGTTIENLFDIKEILLENVSARRAGHTSPFWASMSVGEVESRMSNELNPTPPRFTVPSVIIVNESSAVVKDIVTDIQVDSGIFVRRDK